MKKILLSFVALIAGTFALQAQAPTPCIPNPNNSQAGFYPDTLPHSNVGTYYEEVIDFVFPEDTVFQGFTVPFDSFVVNMVANVPPGLNYQFDRTVPTYYPNNGPARGCLTVYGTPTMVNTSNDSVTVTVTGYVTVFGSVQSGSFDINYHVKVDSAQAVYNTKAVEFDLEVSPNPASQRADVSFRLLQNAEVAFEVININGKVVQHIDTREYNAGSHRINLFAATNELANGVYFVKATIDGLTTLSSKLIINK